jgi:hypothetical protein
MNLVQSTVARFAGIWGLTAEDQQRQLLTMVEVFYPYNVFADESGQSRYGSKAFGVAAYVASFDRWLQQEKEWCGILEKFRVPLDDNPEHTHPFFHTTDFIAREKQFKNDWSNTKRDEFMELLTLTASEHTVCGVSCCVIEQEYDHALPKDIKDQWREPYFFCVWAVLSALVGLERHFTITLPKPLWFLFDRKKKAVKFAGEIFHLMKSVNDPKHVLGEMGFGEMWRTPQLQAADLLVYEMVRRTLDEHHDPKLPLRKSAEKLARKGSLVFINMNTERLERYVQFVREAQEAQARETE